MTSAGGAANKPFSQIIGTLQELIESVLFFAPKMVTVFPGQPQFAARVRRFNIFLYAVAQHLEFAGTLRQDGTRVSIFGPNLDMGATVLDTTVLSNVLNNPANTATLTQLQSAWSANAEIWLYTSGDVPNDALAQAFAKVMGATVRAFDKPFWVLPTFDPATKTILTRDQVGIGDDFNAALATKTRNLRSLDALSTRTFTP